MPSFQRQTRRLGDAADSGARGRRLHFEYDDQRCQALQAVALGGTVAAVGLFHQFLLPGAIDAGVEGEPRACLLLASCNTLALDPACQAKQQAASAR